MIAPVKRSHPEVFYKKDAFKNFPKIRRKTLVLILLSIKTQASIPPENVKNFFVFSHFQEATVEVCNFLRNLQEHLFFINHPR